MQVEQNKNKRRYFISLATNNLLKSGRVDFTLHHSDMDNELISEIANASGINHNHPNFNALSEKIKKSFTFQEICLIMDFLATLEVIEVNVTTATFHLPMPRIPGRNEKTFVVSVLSENFDFSELETYKLPFVILGNYNPYQNR